MSTFEKTKTVETIETIGGQFELKFILVEDLFSTDQVMLEAHQLEKERRLAGGASILLYPPNPLFSVVPHAIGSMPGRGLRLSSALIGAAGPHIGACLEDGGRLPFLIHTHRTCSILLRLISPFGFASPVAG
jgi:hypothetical protein